MADVPPNIPGAPMGAEPMKKTTGKVQPKKETVRINLPPKPSAAPTIKLPTLPPGGPTGSPSAVRPGITTAPRLAPQAAAPAAAPRAATAAPAAPRPARAPAAPSTVGTLDTVLAIAAMVMSLAAIGTTVWMMLMLNNALSNNS